MRNSVLVTAYLSYQRCLNGPVATFPDAFVDRGEVERDMLFLGLLMMKNLVKPESERAIAVLRRAQLRCIMVTGESRLSSSEQKAVEANVRARFSLQGTTF